MRIGVYGGTFDPPHLGHMGAAEAAITALGLDRLLLVPAAVPPHKDLPPDPVPAADRLAMTGLMADGIGLELHRPGVAEASPLELDRPGKSYTADTLTQLRERYPQDELWLLVGTDMLRSLPSWRAPETIARLAGIAAFARHDGDGPELERLAGRLGETLGARVEIIPLPKTVEVSSTRLRTQLATDRTEAAPALWCQVYGYILRKGLYGTNADLKRLSDDELRRCSWSMVKAKRIPHIRGCEGEAERLAERWGADPHQARRAAILHDCTKYLDLEEQLQLCARYGIVLDELERVTVKLLHAKTGAAIARHVYGEPEEVCDAIYWHTTGTGDMTTLAKVLYLADYIEPSRSDFQGLAELRKLAYEDLDAALLLGCELTIEDMEARGMPVHANTLKVRNHLKGR